MKKNKMMRLASVMLVLTMLTTCAISGTFAKYVTEAKATDTARVAKWGMTVEVVGNLFGENYFAKTGDDSGKISASVEGSVDTSGAINGVSNIVAPGTASDKGMTLAIKGDPEVAYTVAYDTEGTNKTIWLKATNYATLVKTDEVTKDNCVGFYFWDGTYYQKATSDTQYANVQWYKIQDEVTVVANSNGNYNPVEWTVTDNKTSTTTPYREVSDVATALTGYFTATGEAKDEIDKSYTVSWKWAFEQGADDDAKAKNNGGDTILGNLMAAGDEYVVVKCADTTYATCSALVADVDYNLQIGFGAKITATQVD